MPGAGSSFPDDVLSELIHRFARSGSLLEPHDHGGVQVSLSEVLAFGELAASEGLSQQVLAERLGLEKSTVSRLVSGMEERGWLTRGRDPANRRYTRLHLTEAGQVIAERIGRDLRARHEAMFAAMTTAERRALTVGLTALARVIDEQGHHGGRREPSPARSAIEA